MPRLDRTNLKILEILSTNGRENIVDVADAVDRAESTVRERIGRLEQDGVILGYAARLDPARIGVGAAARLRARVERARVVNLARALEEVPYVRRAVVTTGPKPLAVDLVGRDLCHLERIVEEDLAGIGLEEVEMQAVCRTLVRDRPLPVQALRREREQSGVEPTIWQPRMTHRPIGAAGARVTPSATRR